MREEDRLRVFENWVLRRVPKRKEVTENGENYINTSFMIGTHQILFG
jgi:hypothetical protein